MTEEYSVCTFSLEPPSIRRFVCTTTTMNLLLNCDMINAMLLFCLQLFKRRVVFVIDISASMKWKPLEDVKKALLECLAKLQAEDVFNIIAFNDEILEFSTSMEFATDETISAVTEWLDSNLIANGETNMLLPLKQVRCLESLIFLETLVSETLLYVWFRQ